MRLLKSASTAIIPIIIVIFNLVSILAIDFYSNGYILIAYYEGEELYPGDHVVIKAELYRAGKRITDPKNTSVVLYIGEYPGIEEVIMEHEKGVFSYDFIIPTDLNIAVLVVQANALINEQEVDFTSLYIPVSIKEDTTHYINSPVHTISHQIVKPNDTITITSYISDITNKTIIPSAVNISITAWIRYNRTDLDSTLSYFPSLYQGNGIFEANYTILTLAVNKSLKMTADLNLLIQINTKILEEEFNDFFSIDIDDFHLISSLKLEGNIVKLRILALDNNFLPMSNVNCSLIRIETDPIQTIFSTELIPSTDEEGTTEITIITENEIAEIDISIAGVKDNKISFKRISALNFLNAPYVNKYSLYILPSISDFEYKIHYNEKGIRGSYLSLLGDEPLKNTELYLYLHWSKGVISLSKTTTDENGLFHIKESWPKGFGKSSLDRCVLRVSYNNKSSWVNTEFWTNPLFSQFPYELAVNEDNIPSFKITEFERYKKLNITWDVSSNLSLKQLFFYPQYKNLNFPSSSVSMYGSFRFVPFPDYTPQNHFLGFTPFQSSLSTTYSELDKVNCVGIIDNYSDLEYMIILGITYSNDYSSGYKYNYWFFNPDGSLKDKPMDFPDPPLFILDQNLLLRISLFIIIAGITIVVFVKGKQAKRNL